MVIYLALLRGINVGGKNIIKMEKLKQLFEAIGLCEVKTYIQSGNVLFKANEMELPLQKKIEDSIKANFGFPVNVVLRSAKELENIVLDCPFNEDKGLFVSFLTNAPLKENVFRWSTYKNENEKYIILGR